MYNNILSYRDYKYMMLGCIIYPPLTDDLNQQLVNINSNIMSHYSLMLFVLS
jgi:hypothetical protein